MSQRETGVVGGVAAPHAPQFFTLPDTEDHDQVARIEQTMRAMGERIMALEPDAVVVVANDHLENFMLEVVPAFTILRGPRASGSFAGRPFSWPVHSDAATALFREFQEQGFDPAASLNAPIGYEFGIPMTFLGLPPETPVIPIFVNSYIPPQPLPDRCYDFGRALHRGARASGLRLVVVASGGLSHYPGTDLYAHPDVETDKDILERMRRGNLRSLLTLGEDALDVTGNVEARSWLILAGALGERVPSEVVMEPSWHHNYAMVSWDDSVAQPEPHELHYPVPQAEMLAFYEALYTLRTDSTVREEYLQDAATVADRYDLTPEQRQAFLSLKEEDFARTGVHPLLGFVAGLEVNLTRKRQANAEENLVTVTGSHND